MNKLNISSPYSKNYTLKNDAGDEFNWEILNIEYSTGLKLVGIDYKNVYKDLLDNKILTDDNKGNINPSKYGKPLVENDEKPPIIVFGIYNSFGEKDDINDYKWEWLSNTYTPGVEGPQETKWFGDWEQLDSNGKEKYKAYIKRYIENRLRIKNGGVDVEQTIIDETVDFVNKKIDFQDVIDNGNKISFMNLINEIDPEKGFNLGDDSNKDVGIVTANRREMFLPKGIQYKGKTVFVDPESDYDLQIIKLNPIKKLFFKGNKDVKNNLLRKTTPLVGNYQGNNVEDILQEENYSTSYLTTSHHIIKKQEKRRVINIDKFKVNGINTTNIHKYDLLPTYVIEGVLRNEKLQESKIVNNSDKRRYYYSNYPYPYPSMVKFINALIDVAIDLLPQFIKTRNLFAKPHEFMFDKILEKVGNNFEFFSDELIEKYEQAKAMTNVEKRVEFVSEDLVLKKYVYIDEETGVMKLSMDSVSVFNLLGFNFGFQFTELIPKFISKKNGRDVSDQSSLKRSINGNFKDDEVGDIRAKQTGNTNGGTNLNNIEREKLRNEVKNSAGDKAFETVSIDYSTGNKDNEIDYDKIYITQEVEKLISKGV